MTFNTEYYGSTVLQATDTTFCGDDLHYLTVDGEQVYQQLLSYCLLLAMVLQQQTVLLTC